MLTLSPRPDVVAVEEPAAHQQYAVVLVNEDQLDRLLRRQRAQIADPRRINAADIYDRYSRLKRRVAAGVIVGAVAAAALVDWNGTSRPLLASFMPFMAAPALPTLPTGAGFSVSAAMPRSGEIAGDMVSRITRMGLPAFARLMPDGRAHQVLVGPYAYLDEAEGAQRRLDALGFGRGRLFVDDGLRALAGADGAAPRGDNPGMLLIGAAERVSLVFEMPEDVGRPAMTRLGEAALGIDLGPMSALREQRLAAPPGVSLLRDVAIEEIISEDGTRHAYARVSFHPSARATVRAEGQRVYVDLAWPQEIGALPARSAPRLSGAAPVAKAPVERPVADSEDYTAAVRPIRLRFEEVSPFVLTSARMASPEVLAALEQTLASLDASLAAVNVPAGFADEHGRFQAAIRAARLAMNSAFIGDRLAQAHEAVGMYGEVPAPR